MNDPVQRTKSFEIRGNWFRWTSYDLLNGVIVPADGAELLEYDPWHPFRANAGKYRTVKQPYTALLELHRNLADAESRNIRPWQPSSRFVEEPKRGPENEADRLILDWCNSHGLLGLVPVLSNSIRPRATIEPGPDECTRVVKRRHHFRDGGIWHSWVTTAEPSAATTDGAEDAARRFAEQDPKPGATWFKWLTHMYEEKPVEHIRDFFLPSPFGLYPHEAMDFQPPCPNTSKFWESYGEPVWEFAEWCEMFALSVDYLSGWKGGKTNAEPRAVQESHWVLSGLAQTTAPSFRFNPERNTVDEERVSAGLLASYALMFLWDRVEGRRALRCQNCNSYLISDEPRARYCSPRCRNTAQGRRYRSKKDAAK